MYKPRTLIIGLDGATFDLIKPWAQMGDLPTFKKILDQGVHRSLKVWPNMNSASSWSSIVTGYNPGLHGIFSFGDAPPQRGTQWHPNTAADRKKNPFWRLLSAAGKQVGVINVPISYPADPVNGFMLSGMDTPGLRSPRFAHPPNLLEELQLEGIDYVIDVHNLGVQSRRNPHRLPESVKRMVDARSRTIHYLIQNHPWDVMMAVFVAPDRVQHCYWPKEETPLDSSDWTPIRSLYQQIDSFFNHTLELIDENTTLLVISDHGFGPMRFAVRCLNPLFAQLGLLHYNQGRSQLRGRFLENLLLYGRRIIPYRFQNPLARALPGLHLQASMQFKFSGIEWSQTQVYAEPFAGQIFINLQGREPEGIVSAKEYPSLCERVRDILLKLTDPESGSSLVRAIYRPEDLYHGPYSTKAADLTIDWDYGVLRDALCYHSEGKPTIIKTPKRKVSSRWRGTHRSDGIFIAYGPNIKKGMTMTNATLYDITPTLFYLQGHPIPEDMDGKVLMDIFIEGHLRRNPIQRCKPSDIQWEANTVELGEEETKKIEKRLRGLGYIE
jgi:predicted AlkP superfamily phosphohydrolase/phosphomutase